MQTRIYVFKNITAREWKVEVEEKEIDAGITLDQLKDKFRNVAKLEDFEGFALCNPVIRGLPSSTPLKEIKNLPVTHANEPLLYVRFWLKIEHALRTNALLAIEDILGERENDSKGVQEIRAAIDGLFPKQEFPHDSRKERARLLQYVALEDYVNVIKTIEDIMRKEPGDRIGARDSEIIKRNQVIRTIIQSTEQTLKAQVAPVLRPYKLT